VAKCRKRAIGALPLSALDIAAVGVHSADIAIITGMPISACWW
jgi:hypothetical protein